MRKLMNAQSTVSLLSSNHFVSLHNVFHHLLSISVGSIFRPSCSTPTKHTFLSIPDTCVLTPVYSLPVSGALISTLLPSRWHSLSL
jgi:hypothetical protein